MAYADDDGMAWLSKIVLPSLNSNINDTEGTDSSLIYDTLKTESFTTTEWQEC